MFRLTLERCLSLAVAVAYLALIYRNEGGSEAMESSITTLLPLACIWFAHELSYYRGWGSLHVVDEGTEETAIRIAGWALLLLPFFLFLIAARQE
ncbi:MAG: hypothetical protein H6817_08240 [Phycisphaerales bacterium]|nr:hypothetical protein [Phycisphaerales bacterium]